MKTKFLGVLLALVFSNAFAVTECSVTPISVFSGDDGYFWIYLSNGGSAYMPSTDPDFKQSFALATAAVMGDKNLVIRYSADGVNCASTIQPFIGLWLVK